MMGSSFTSSESRAENSVSIFIWASVGFIFLIVQLYVYGSWIISSDFKPTNPGSDPIPDYSRYWMYAFQTVSLLGAVVAVWWFARGIRQTGKIDAVRLLMLGWLSAYWLDPFLNFLRPMFTYNAYLINYGCWCEFIPGWQSANGSRIAEPLLVDIPNYFFNFTATAVSGLWAINKAKCRWPGISNIGKALAALVGIWIAMGALDVAATRIMHFDAWPGSTQKFSLWGGQFFQFPLYEFLLFPLPFIACAFLLHSVNEKGYSSIEGGTGKLENLRMKTLFRILAFVGFCNVLNLTYTTTMGVITLKSDPWPSNMPSWLINEQCGDEIGIACSR